MPNPIILAAGAAFATAAAMSAQAPLLTEVGAALPDGLGQIIATADFNGDNVADLLTTSGVFYNDDGFFVAGPSMPASFDPASDVRAIAVADFDGDGRADVVVATPSVGGSGLSILQTSIGAASLLSTAIAVPGAGSFGSLAAADFDADGDVDLIAASVDPAQPRFEWLRNDGFGGWTLAGNGQWPVQAISAAWLGAGDFDGDGLIDVYVASGGSPLWRRNLGGGAFGGSQSGSVATTADAGAVGDFDGDGFDDVLLFDVSGTVVVQSGSAAGPVPVGISVMPALAAPAVVIDLNGDGRDDLIRTNVAFRGMTEAELVVQYGSPIGLGFATPLGDIYLTYGTSVPFGPLRPYPGVAALDVDGDLDIDTVVGPGNHVPWIDLNTGPSLSSRAFSALPGGLRALAAAPRDVDGDGDADLLHARISTGSIQLEVYHNDGRGLFAAAPVPAGTYSALVPRTGSWADLDSDGDADLLFPGGVPGTAVTVLRNDGSGTFSFGTGLPGAESPAALVVADFTGDQIADVVIGRSLMTGPGVVYQTPQLFAGIATPGGVAFAPPVAFGVAELLTDLVAFDADQDGDLDIVAGSSGILPGGGPARIYENNGIGQFTALPQFMGTATMHVAVGDLNGDGLQDLVLGDQTWLRQGSGFVPFANHTKPKWRYSLADLDEDGALDLVDQAGQWYPGDGSGAFAAPISFVQYASGSVWMSGGGRAPIDLDGDGDLDMIGPHSQAPGHLSIYSNLMRHTAPRSLAATGAVLTVAAYGQANEPFFMGVSLASQGPVALPPFGTLFLNTNAIIVVAFGVTPLNGRSDVLIGIPTNWSGFTLSWQTLMGVPLRLSNCFDTPIAL